MTLFFPSLPGGYPVEEPYAAAIPASIMQGDSVSWSDVSFTDENGVEYDSGTYTLRYVLAGPSAPLVLTAVPNGDGWMTSISSAQSAALTPGTYKWVAQVLIAGTRVTIAEGPLTLEADLALASAGYDPRTVAEKALADAEAALATFQASGGRVQAYTIGDRHMAFQRDADILAIVNYWRTRVNAERTKALGARSRLIGVRFDRAR